MPLHFIPITIDRSLVDDPLEPSVSNLAFANSVFTNASTSVIRQMQSVQAECDLIALESGLNEAYTKVCEERKTGT